MNVWGDLDTGSLLVVSQMGGVEYGVGLASCSRKFLNNGVWRGILFLRASSWMVLSLSKVSLSAGILIISAFYLAEIKRGKKYEKKRGDEEKQRRVLRKKKTDGPTG